MMTGEKTKSEQVLLIIAQCMGIIDVLIVAYAIKPKFMHIPAEEMIYADPLSRLSQPLHTYIKKTKISHAMIFKKRQWAWFRKHKVWKTPPPCTPSIPQALELGKIWTTLQNKQISHSKIAKVKTLKRSHSHLTTC